MARKSDNRIAFESQAASLPYLAAKAFAAHVAMIQAERKEPALADNPYWASLRDSAYARFQALMEAL